ncbi:MAG TPA: CHAD domain-containing protein [Acidimicrobiia bacterium]|nr:CHAD domain-containing protein [Acidimicrobiia bacterium]
MDEPLTVTDIVRRAISRAHQRLVDHAAEVRATAGPEAVHQARVATRRLRSDLRTFEPWLEPRRAAELRGELRWLGAELGSVRDLDVMRDRLRAHACALPAAEADAAERVIRRLDADREAARADLVTILAQARYGYVRADLADAAANPPCTAAAATTPATVLATAVRKRWRKLDHGVDKLGDHPADDALHAVRVRAKRCRYAADACVPAFGDPAREFAAAMARIQDALGEHHDAVVAGAWLAKTAHECTPAEAYALGMLAEVERDSADAATAEFATVWETARRKRLRRWL